MPLKQGQSRVPFVGWLILFAVLSGVIGVFYWTESSGPLTVEGTATEASSTRSSASLDQTNPGELTPDTLDLAEQDRVEEAQTNSGDGKAQVDERHGWVGTARDQAGSPVANATLAWTSTWEQVCEDEFTTDLTGQFFIPFPTELYWSEDDTSGLITLGQDWAPILHSVPPPSSPPTPVEITLQTAQAWLPVRVLNKGSDQAREGLPIVLRAHGFTYEAFTDQQGRARLAGHPAINMQLNARDPFSGWLQSPEPLVLEPGENPELVVYYQGSPEVLNLKAVDHRSGAPLTADWSVQEEFGQPATLLVAGSHLFTWDALEQDLEGEPCNLQVSAEGYLPTHFEWSESSPGGVIEVRLEPQQELELPMRILHRGRAIANEAVKVSANGPFQSEEQTLRDRNKGLALEEYSGMYLQTSHTTSASGEITARLPWSRNASFPQLIRIELLHFDTWLETDQLGPLPWTIDFGPPSERLGIRLLNESNEAVVGQEVRLWYEGDANSPTLWAARSGPYRRVSVRNNAWLKSDLKATSNELGEVWLDVALGVPFLWATPQGQDLGELRSQPALTAGEQRVIEFQMGERREISGQLIRPDGRQWDGIPLSVELLDAHGNRPLSSDRIEPASWSQIRTTRNSGVFVFPSVPSGQYQLHVSPARLQTETWVEPGQTDLQVPLQAMNRIRLRLLDSSTGQLIAGETWGYIRHARGGNSWGIIWEGEGMIEFPSGEQVVLDLEAEGYRAKEIPLGDFAQGGHQIERTVELQAGREVVLRVAPAEAVEDGRFAGMQVRTSEGEEFTDLPYSYRTDPGLITIFALPREALQVWLLERHTEKVLQKVDIPASPDGERVEVAVSW